MGFLVALLGRSVYLFTPRWRRGILSARPGNWWAKFSANSTVLISFLQCLGANNGDPDPIFGTGNLLRKLRFDGGFCFYFFLMFQMRWMKWLQVTGRLKVPGCWWPRNNCNWSCTANARGVLLLFYLLLWPLFYLSLQILQTRQTVTMFDLSPSLQFLQLHRVPVGVIRCVRTGIGRDQLVMA